MTTSESSRVVELKARRLWLVLGWLLVALIIYLSLMPSPVQLPLKGGDKFSHVIAYFVLMSWFANLYEVPAQRLQFALGFCAMGLALEFLQRWTGYRLFEVMDMLASTAGVAVGWVLAPPRLPNYLRLVETVFKASNKN